MHDACTIKQQETLRRSRSYGVVWNSRVACWRWLFQTISADRNMALISRQMAPTSVVQEMEVWGDGIG